ncbi:MAG TPA: hypothetical protein DEB30_02565 [Candidatus Peribacter riflensis]|uniref:Uncharacterized protein n=1 Tax=Candidatus Peribacter riflensis TaxID=1735162 RepID=A0A0S1SP22_9BACT|nr:MAG: hypothetical protein PeribacterA2_0527 [Candidatus Peribacter riflensis]OGJ77061.1 MAG: hypothetical protein A2398_02950 [Candidatus Peribacteria bacterium RIFOXYB1_FULL_57_12]OGJ82636.1 MAG: hypothetical protein A2412_03440 [Candidatus Peribacteria bacterium RIFOXYC1_FULL_58_8]ALM11008.1 MAG: hypothetical protein PeribacterB2_0526 [Candidatus Peribacter riflensis]ALM12111.1 MAG: hypothetical protein PeribacterC2_0526 [Candidatus Peribacter riflensis]
MTCAELSQFDSAHCDNSNKAFQKICDSESKSQISQSQIPYRAMSIISDNRTITEILMPINGTPDVLFLIG